MAGFPRAFYLVTGLATLTFIGSTLTQPFFSLYVAEKGSSPLELGLILSLMAYTTLAVRLPLGLASSRLGIWWVVPLALLGQAAADVLYSLVASPVVFYPIRVFHAVSSALLQPTLMALASAIAPEGRKGEALGIYLTSVGLAMMGGPLLCSALLAAFDYATILRVAAIIPLLALPVYLGLRRTTALGPLLARTRRRDPAVAPSWRNLKQILALKPVQALTYGRFTFAIVMAIITTLYPLHAVNTLHIDPATYALFYTLEGLANTVIRLPTGRLSDLIGRKKPLLTSFALLAAALLLFATAEDPVTIGVTMFLYGVAHGMRAVSEWSFLGDVVSSDDLSLSNFYFTSVFDLGSALGATFAGSATMLWSTPDVLRIAAVIAASSIAVIAATKTPHKH